jgi:hypothetical protein
MLCPRVRGESALGSNEAIESVQKRLMLRVNLFPRVGNGLARGQAIEIASNDLLKLLTNCVTCVGRIIIAKHLSQISDVYFAGFSCRGRIPVLMASQQRSQRLLTSSGIALSGAK